MHFSAITLLVKHFLFSKFCFSYFIHVIVPIVIIITALYIGLGQLKVTNKYKKRFLIRHRTTFIYLKHLNIKFRRVLELSGSYLYLFC